MTLPKYARYTVMETLNESYKRQDGVKQMTQMACVRNTLQSNKYWTGISLNP